MDQISAVPVLTREPRIRFPTLRQFAKKPLGVAGALWVIVIVLASAFAPLLAPYDPNAIDLAVYLRGPSASHWLGTDDLGRDVLSRILYGGRPALFGVLVAVVPWLVLGTFGGLVAGYRKGFADQVISRVVDIFFAVPILIVLLVIAALYPESLAAMMATFGFIASAGLIRIVRAGTIAVRDENYVAAARVSGLTHFQVMFRHILPRIASLIFVQLAIFSAIALVMESGLAFLGLGTQVPNASWGGMIADAHNVITNDGWLLIPPGVVILLTAVALILLGNAIRDVASARWSSSALMSKRSAPSHMPIVKPIREKKTQRNESTTPKLLSVRNLSVDLLRGRSVIPVLTDISFDVAHGETVGLVGESGSGKTTIGNAILGILPQELRLSAGSCVLSNRVISEMSPKEMARVRGRQIALISQDPQASLDPNFSVGSQLREAVRRHTECSRKAARVRSLELLAMVSLPDPALVARRYPWQLSGGMAQRVAIALALAGGPELLIADEPTTALDVTVQAEVLNLLRELQANHGMAILLISHDWGVIADLCQRAVVCYSGEVVELAEVQELFDLPLHPYTRALLRANPHGRGDGEPLFVIPGSVPRLGEWPSGCRFAPRCEFASAECVMQPIQIDMYWPHRECRCIHVAQELSGSPS
jgi:peptide/nickel transport system permease protein